MWLIKVLQYLTRLINQGEETAITFVSTIVPWIVPAVPAWLTFSHSINPLDLNFPWPIGLCVALSVEFLGLTSMYRSFQFFEHNRKYKDATKKSPTWIPVCAYVLYLVIVLSVNVVLDASRPPVNIAHIVAVGLLSVLSVPAGVLIAVMAVHEERKALAEQERERAREQRLAHRQNQNRSPVLGTVPEPVLQNHSGSDGSGRTASRFREQIWSILEREWENQSGVPVQERKIPGTTEIAEELKLDKHRSKSYIWGQTREWMNARGVPQEH